VSFDKRFINAENLPNILAQLEIQHLFCLSAEDFVAVAQRILLRLFEYINRIS